MMTHLLRGEPSIWLWISSTSPGGFMMVVFPSSKTTSGRQAGSAAQSEAARHHHYHYNHRYPVMMRCVYVLLHRVVSVDVPTALQTLSKCMSEWLLPPAAGRRCWAGVLPSTIIYWYFSCGASKQQQQRLPLEWTRSSWTTSSSLLICAQTWKVTQADRGVLTEMVH